MLKDANEKALGRKLVGSSAEPVRSQLSLDQVRVGPSANQGGKEREREKHVIERYDDFDFVA
jgi:hypothetical protein